MPLISRLFSGVVPLVAALLCMTHGLLAAPAVTVTSPTPETTVGTLTSVSITFSEAVSNVDADDLLIDNEAAVSVTGSGAGPYVFTFTQPPPGLVSVSWDINHAISGIGTGAFVPVDGWSYTLTDIIAPTIAKIRTSVVGQEMDAVLPVAGSTVGVLTRVEVQFSEPVTGVDVSDLLVNGAATATSVTGSDAGPYLFTIPQPSAGLVTFQWAASHGIKDTASLPNDFAGGSWSCTLSASGAGSAVINEFLAANATSINDENGNGEDWIEIYNPGPNPVNLTGWALTNDVDQPEMWVFPNRTIAANAYLVVFASGKDRKPASGNLHTNFKINESGGYLALMKPDSPRSIATVFADYPAQRFDYSYGPQTGGALRYFARVGTGTDTRPGTANGTSSLTGVTPKPNASVSRGFFVDPFQLVLTCTDPNATIRYTINGSDVTASSPAYTGPLTIDGTRVLRMAAFSNSSIPSTTVTHTYLFLDQVLAQPGPPYDNPAVVGDEANPQPPNVGGLPFPVAWGSRSTGSFPGLITNLSANQVPADYGMDPEILNDANKYNDNGAVDPINGKTNLQRVKQALRDLPIMSIVMKNDDMFGSSGLYPNSISKGTGFEKPCSVEFILPDGSTGFATTCGIRMHGNASRSPENDPKHGMKLNFKGDFGADSLEYQLFPDSPIKKFDDLILRGDFNSSWLHHDNGTQRPKGTRIRDAYCKDTFRDMGHPAGHHRYVNLFINGIYWGTYDPTEQENNGFAEAYFGGDKNDYAVFEQSPNIKSGADTPLPGEAIGPYASLVALTSPVNNATYEKVKRWLDVPEFVDYMLLHFWEGHQDWGDDVNKNWYAVRNAKTGGSFKYLPWDQENLFWLATEDRTGVTSPPTGIHPKLVSNPQYRLDFADRVHKHMVAPDGALQSSSALTRLSKWTAIMNANAMAAESARWGDYRRDVHPFSSTGSLYTWNGTWRTEINRLSTGPGSYFAARTNTVLNQLRTRGLYPTINAPQIQNNATNAVLGSQQLPVGTLIKLVPVSAPAGTTLYYTTDGSDPRVYYDTTGSRTPTAVAYTTPIAINATTVIKVRALNGTSWSALNEATFVVGSVAPAVRITEIMYNPPSANGGSSAEFIEIQNTGTTAVDLSGWFLDGIDFVFPSGFTLGGGARAVLASNNAPAVFAAQYPGVAVAGYFGGSLDNSGEHIGIHDATGDNIASVTYDDEVPWPTSPDGQGPSLEIIDPNGDANDPFNWKASAAAKGTPGQANSAATFTVRISEVLANNVTVSTPAGAGFDFVELQNTSGAALDIGGWQVQVQGGSNYSFPGGTVLGAGDYAVAYFAPGEGTQIPDRNCTVTLRTNSGVIADGVRFGSQVPDQSIGRVAGSWTLCTPTPAAANTAASLAPVTNLAINEWLANAGPSVNDWIELYNKDASLPVQLTGLYVQAGTNLVRYPTLSFLKPHGFVQLQANEGKGPDSLDLKIPAEGTTLKLLDANTVAFDTVTFAAQAENVTSGRLPDGTGAVTAFNGSASPAAANFLLSSYTGPVLNEVLVRNASGALTPWATRPGWVEFRNTGALAFDMSGMRMNTADSLDGSWTFPSGTIVPAGGYLLVWCDPSHAASLASAANLNSALPLTDSSAGVLQVNRGVYLYNTTGQRVAFLEWGQQAPDFSIGLDSGTVKLLASPTPGFANAAAAALGSATSLRINEWAAAETRDWFELYNTDASPVSLTGLYLSDDPGEIARKKFQVGPLSFIGPAGYAVFYATDHPEYGPDNVSFSLADTGEYLRLSANDASATVIDAVSFGLATAGVSTGRIPDGSATIATSLSPTPRGKNATGNGPSVFQQPSNVIAMEGSNVTFVFGTTGQSPLSITWSRNGSPIPEGANSSILSLIASTATEGSYFAAISNGSGSDTTQTASLTVIRNFSQWATANGIAGAAANGDDDGDGIPNLVEFIHGLNPDSPQTPSERAAALPQVGLEPATGTPTYVTLTYRRSARASLSDIAYELSTSPAAGAWAAQAPTVVENLAPDPVTGDPRVRAKFLIPAGETKYFVRLRLVP